MPGLKDLLKKKEKLGEDAQAQGSAPTGLSTPEFKFIRTTTEQEEVIQPPTFAEDEEGSVKSRKSKSRMSQLGFRKSSNAEYTKDPTAASTRDIAEKENEQLPLRPKSQRKLSERLHMHARSRSASGESSEILPQDLPAAPDAVSAPAAERAKVTDDEKQENQQREAQWEKRATMLAQSNPLLEAEMKSQQEKARSRSKSPSISDAQGDVNIQEAIRLHESGELEASTGMFGQLADTKGANNALSQVLYGLALRHGWGIKPEPEKAIHYLSLAASNSASIEQQALESGMKKGGAAKGELVLAIFELANCFRHGWGVKKDAVAARQYYETAANLGDTDAMDEAAWCCLEGFGGGKDKVCLLLLPSTSSQSPTSRHAASNRLLVNDVMKGEAASSPEHIARLKPAPLITASP